MFGVTIVEMGGTFDLEVIGGRSTTEELGTTNVEAIPSVVEGVAGRDTESETST